MMNGDTKRFLVPVSGPEVERIRIGLSILMNLCEETEGASDAILFIAIKRNIQGPTLEEAIGRGVCRSLLKGERVPLPGGGFLRLRTQRTFQELGTSDIILAVYARKAMLDTIDSARNAAAVIVVPFRMEDVEEWKSTWNPSVFGEEPTPPRELIRDPVVEEALMMLTRRVNLSTGLSHPSDKEAAVQLFRLLFDNGIAFEPDSIRPWALRHGWTPGGADELRDVAQAVLDRRPIRGGRHPHWRPDTIDYLRDRARDG